MNPDTTPCTKEQRDAIVSAAQIYVRYVRWLSKKQMTSNDEYIKRQVSEVLAQFTEGTST